MYRIWYNFPGRFTPPFSAARPWPHSPAHIHVYGDGEAKILIVGAEGPPELVYSIGLKTNDRRRAMDVVLERQAAFLAKWYEIHGGVP